MFELGAKEWQLDFQPFTVLAKTMDVDLGKRNLTMLKHC
jgi:hypothetical protein